MESFIDLHVHSTASDGTFTPSQLVEHAIKKGLRAIALTDHDTTDGVLEALNASRDTSLLVVPGIELSTCYCNNRDIHILGLNIDIQNKNFQEQLQYFQKERENRNEKIIEKLQQAGLQITLEQMKSRFPDSVWTRAHLARFLMDTGQVHSLNEAFNRYLGDHAPCFVPRHKVSPQQAIRLIHEGNGKAVLAHPLLYHLSSTQLEELVKVLADEDLDGLEAIYSTNRGMEETHMRQLARKYNLFITGGSDFHGTNKPSIDLGVGRGNLKIPSELLNNLS
ncbi:MAG: PHP domain-containing protein [Clostridia bacterium]|nr:PHP domain-containing protein [Clostridia bacterium]